MPYRNPTYIQGKIKLIEQGLLVDISEEELQDLEAILRGARSFYIDILQSLHDRAKVKHEDMDAFIAEENRNLAGVEMALRKIDDFRKSHSKHIKQKEDQ